MRRHSEQIGGTGLDDAVERARRVERRVRNELTAAHDGDCKTDDTDIMAERTERIDDRISIESPVRDDRPAIREHGVVGMHDTFRLPGGSGGEGQIDDAIGIGRDRKRSSGCRHHVAAEPQDRARLGNVRPATVRADTPSSDAARHRAWKRCGAFPHPRRSPAAQRKRLSPRVRASATISLQV